MRKIINAFQFIKINGINSFFKECYYRLIDNYYEKHFGVNTKGGVSKEDLGIESPDSVEYAPVHYKHVFYMLNSIPLDINDITLLDYGCGKGRLLVCAATYKYKKIIGIELSTLINMAKINVDKMRCRKTKHIIFISRRT